MGHLPTLLPEGGHIIRPWRLICVPGLLRIDIFEPTGDPEISKHSESAQNARKTVEGKI